ncbi:MAG: hypothetical protein NWF02_05970 [Candidatus Bathyarchaeota archaeon]|nr:hypothetical protein [Candidatus Bathyarchaeum sp.]
MAMKNSPILRFTFSLNARVKITINEPNRAYTPVNITKSTDKEMGKNNGPIPIEKQASKMQLPKVLPIVSLN